MGKMSRANHLTVSKFTSKQEFSSILILAVLLTVTAILQDNFLQLRSIMRDINSFSPLILLTMGQAIVIVSGGLDLSAGTSLSLYTCILTYVMRSNEPITGLYAILITLVAAVLVGVINGIGVGYLRIPPVIVTFATSFMWLGAALFIRPTPGGEAVNWFKAFYRFQSVRSFPEFIKAMGSYISPALILVIIGCLVWYVISKTKTGKYIYAVGSNNDGAYENGIDTGLVQTKAYVLNSLFIFLAALFFVGQNMSGDARMGDPLTLRAIASAVVGGIALTGGRGSVYMAIVGALIMSYVNKVIFFADIPNAYQTLVGGLIVIIAIAGSKAYTLYSKKAMLKGE